MSSAIINKLFKYIDQEAAEHLIINHQEERITLDYHLPNGQIKSLNLPKKLEEDFFANLLKILSIKDGDLINHQYRHFRNKEKQLKIYLSVLPQQKGKKIIINFIRQDFPRLSLNQLGLDNHRRKQLKQAVQSRSGLIIVSSPEQSGKTTTLYALLDLVDQEKCNVYVLDDRSPFSLRSSNQLTLNANNWQRILQHDSDVILIDDLDQTKNLEQALQAAASGRLVIGTITASSSFKVLAKILELPLAKSIKLDALKLIINQRLVALRSDHQKNRKRKKIALFETLNISQNIKKLIRKNSDNELSTIKFAKKLAQAAIKDGFYSLTRDKKEKIKTGII